MAGAASFISWKKALIPLASLPLIALLAYGFRIDPKAIPSPLVKKPAPAFQMAIYDGEAVTLEGLKGKPVVLNFWASWCFPACYEEAPLLESTWRAYKEKGVAFVGVDIQDKEPNAREFLRRFNYTFPNGPDPGSKISIDYGVYGVPETFFINRRGQIAYKHVGALTPELIQTQLDSLLREQ